MTRSSVKNATQCHTLNFFYDDDDGCALTVFLNGVRFHIIADVERLKCESKKGNAIERDYRELISAVRNDLEEDEDPDKVQKKKELDAAEVHDPDKEAHDSQDSGHGMSDNEDDVKQGDDDADSGVDVSEETQEVSEIGVRGSGVVLGEQYAPESEKAIQNWMLSPFGPIFEKLAPASKAPKHPTLDEWYHGQSYFFNLEIRNGQLSASQEEESDDLNQRIRDLIPHMPLPKYLKDLEIPRIQARDIIVLEEGTDPEPYHPIRVNVNGETRFLKMVDMSQYQPTKREIKLLKEVENKGLHKQIRVPQVLGLVYMQSKSEIMGFLQTDIEDPTPLTKMLDSDVVEDNRKKWADETERVIDLLHENDIIWGDAKADNFMIDKHGDLWIIDFGGSYTDGWIDPELMETEEGDDMGTDKIVNALRDPEANTFEPGYDSEGSSNRDEASTSRKRSRADVADTDEEDEQEESSSKRRRET